MDEKEESVLMSLHITQKSKSKCNYVTLRFTEKKAPWPCYIFVNMEMVISRGKT